MGNSQSSAGPSIENMDIFVADYMLTQNIQDLIHLRDPEKCTALVKLTSNLLEEKVSIRELTHLATRFIKKPPESRKQMCFDIAKVYIKISHVFASIITTINPMYTYKDRYDKVIRVALDKKSSIPDDVDVKIDRTNNICSERIHALLNKSELKGEENGIMKIKPKFCQMNRNNSTGKTKSLEDEPGIPDLRFLYYDHYNNETGEFQEMSKKMKEKYKNDLTQFYQVFTGNKTMPSNITHFSHIKLRDHHNSAGCDNKSSNIFEKEYVGSNESELFKQYAQHIQTMIKNANENQIKLLNILHKLFIYHKDEERHNKKISIHPMLTEQKIDEIISETRNLLVNMFSTCESDFVQGLKIFEAIVEDQIKETTQSQIQNLEENIERELTHSKKYGGRKTTKKKLIRF